MGCVTILKIPSINLKEEISIIGTCQTGNDLSSLASFLVDADGELKEVFGLNFIPTVGQFIQQHVESINL